MNLDVSDLQISIEEQESWRRVMNVTIPASIVQAEEQRAAQQLASRARLKGFRKGTRSMLYVTSWHIERYMTTCTSSSAATWRTRSRSASTAAGTRWSKFC